jgi:hypothetical protein
MITCSVALPASKRYMLPPVGRSKASAMKPGAASFFANLEGELLALERQLWEGKYRPGRYVAFEVDDPKKRMVSAAPFRDRVVLGNVRTTRAKQGDARGMGCHPDGSSNNQSCGLCLPRDHQEVYGW